MDIRVEEVDKNNKVGWQVVMNGKPVLCCWCQAEAEAFAERLASRVKAPHDLPATFFECDGEFVAMNLD